MLCVSFGRQLDIPLMTATEPKRSHPPLWLFSLVLLAGSVGPFVLVAMPFLLRREGITVETISKISAVAM